MSLKRKTHPSDVLSLESSASNDEEAASESLNTMTKYIKTEQLLNRSPSSQVIYNNHSPPDEHEQREYRYDFIKTTTKATVN